MSIVIRKLSDEYNPTQEELEAIKSIQDEEIDFSDAPETYAEFWASAAKVSPQTDRQLIGYIKSEQEL